MGRRFLLYMLIVFATFLKMACESNACFEKGGNEMEEVIEVDSFSEKLESSNVFILGFNKVAIHLPSIEFLYLAPLPGLQEMVVFEIKE